METCNLQVHSAYFIAGVLYISTLVEVKAVCWPGLRNPDWCDRMPAGTSPLSQREAAGSRAATTGRNSSEHIGSLGTAATQQPAPFVKPLYISKVNTVAQISLIGGCITSAWWGWPPEGVLLGLGGLTGGLTVASGVAYFRQHRSGT